MEEKDYKKWIKRLDELYKQAESMNEENPSQLAKQIEIYAEILGIIGKFHAASAYDYGKAYADRKQIYGILLANTDGTQRDKEGVAEEGSYEARLEEAKAESEMIRWKNAFIATQELIQAKKKSLEVLLYEYNMKTKVNQ